LKRFYNLNARFFGPISFLLYNYFLVLVRFQNLLFIFIEGEEVLELRPHLRDRSFDRLDLAYLASFGLKRGGGLFDLFVQGFKFSLGYFGYFLFFS